MPRFTASIEKNKRDRWNLIQQNRSVVENAEKEGRAINPEERAQIDKMDKTIGEHDARIKDLEKYNADDENLEGAEGGGGDRSGRPAVEERSGDKGKESRHNASKSYQEAYRSFLQDGEKRDVTMGTQSSGGALVMPVQTSEDIVKQIDNQVFIKAHAKRYKVDKAQALGVRRMTTRASDAAWTTEVGQLTPDTALAFDLRDLNPNLLAKLVTVSIRMLSAGVDVEGTVNEEMAYKMSIPQEAGFMTGNGTGQPLGLFTASASGIPTSQDVTSSVAASFNCDDLIAARYAIKQGYLQGPDAAWIFNRTVVKIIRTLKDSNGRYIWQPGLSANKPDTILDVPLYVSEYSPNTMTSGSYYGIVGNLKMGYAIAEVKDMWIQRLVERYADINEVGFIGRTFVDGAPVLAEAFARLKCA